MEVNPSTIMRRVHRYAPEFEKRVRACQGYGSTSWRADKMYIKVGGRWKYLFRAVDKHGVLSTSCVTEPEMNANQWHSSQEYQLLFPAELSW